MHGNTHIKRAAKENRSHRTWKIGSCSCVFMLQPHNLAHFSSLYHTVCVSHFIREWSFNEREENLQANRIKSVLQNFVHHPQAMQWLRCSHYGYCMHWNAPFDEFMHHQKWRLELPWKKLNLAVSLEHLTFVVQNAVKLVEVQSGCNSSFSLSFLFEWSYLHLGALIGSIPVSIWFQMNFAHLRRSIFA